MPTTSPIPRRDPTTAKATWTSVTLSPALVEDSDFGNSADVWPDGFGAVGEVDGADVAEAT